MSKDEKIQSWEKHYSNAKEKEFYSIKRIDILTISISGACIYIVFEILRFLNSTDSTGILSCTILLKISAIASVFAITMNFLSQILGFQANKYEANYSREVINQIEDEVKNDEKLKYLVELMEHLCPHWLYPQESMLPLLIKMLPYFQHSHMPLPRSNRYVHVLLRIWRLCYYIHSSKYSNRLHQS